MNGDVGKQYCGECPPSTPDTPSTMAVESPVEAPAFSTSSSSDSSSGAAASTESPSTTNKASVPETIEEMAAAKQSSNSSTEQEGNSEGSISVVSGQQNGEVPLESTSSQSTTSLLPTPPLSTPPPSNSPLPTPVPSSSDEVPKSSGKVETIEQNSELAPTNESQATQTTPAQTPTPATPAAQPQPASQPQLLTRDQIQQLVAQQVEYFFSRENLSNDPYLISQMDSDQYVPVFILADCSQFKNITKDHSIIVEALKESPYVQLDEENNRVRPNYKRCIVILREIPESTPVEEIEAVFKSDECPKVVSCEFVHNSSWYVTFESDEDAQKAYWFLRGTVQTFKGKPILARIKTKPVSRLGCLSVLPSYGGKGGSEGKDGSGPPSTPGSAGIPSGPGTPQQNANFNAQTGQRFMYSPPTTVNANSFTHTYTMPTNMPTAFFYPNMVQWTAPGGFYDINGFLQFNGLSPQAAYKPPTTNHNMRYNQNRRNNKRDGNRYDKGDNRHNSGNQGANNQSGHMGAGGHYHPRPYNRPQSSQSPSLVHRTSHPPPLPPNNNGGGPPPPPPPPPPPSSHSSTPVSSTVAGNNHPNHLSFAHSEIALASQSDLYTSFSPPMGSALHVIRNDKKEEGASAPSSKVSSNNSSSQLVSTSTTSSANTPSSSTSMLNIPVSTIPAATSVTSAAITSVVASTTTTQIPPSTQNHHAPPPPPPPHRSNYHDHPHQYNHNYHHYHNMPRDPQPPRQLARGGRRRPRGRDDETMTSGGGRGAPQRGMASQPPTADNKSGNNSQESTPPPPPQPQFDLQATAFPPLPGADEQAPVAEEKRPSEPITSPWGNETQRFSDVMKGTSKTRPVGEKDPEPTATVVSSSSSAPQVISTSTVAAAGTQASQVSTSTATVPVPSQGVTTGAPVTSTVNTTSSSSAVNTAPNANVQTSTAGNKQTDTRPSPREQRGVREDRRLGACGGYRERREYIRDHPRDYTRDHQRDTTRIGNNVRDRDYHRGGRDGGMRSGKENRPIPSRQWKEEKADAEGWITKGPREPRSHREVNREQRETRTPLVNGDSSPPPSPKAPKTEAKVSGEESSAEEKLSCSQSLNNNDGEHKTSWAKMALASKDHMERLAAELKEKEEQEKKLRFHTRPQTKPQEKVLIPRERDGKPLRREGPPRENRLSSERGPLPFRPRDSARPKSPK